MIVDVHPPKIEIFDVDAMTNLDPKGTTRDVEEFRVEEFGLYMARPAPGRRQFDYIESWILPALGIRITDFWFTEGHERDQDFYLDIARIERDGGRWRVTDLYLDIVLRSGKDLRVIDADELVAATAAGLISKDDAQWALETAYTTVDGIAGNAYDLGRWLAPHGAELTWRRH